MKKYFTFFFVVALIFSFQIPQVFAGCRNDQISISGGRCWNGGCGNIHRASDQKLLGNSSTNPDGPGPGPGPGPSCTPQCIGGVGGQGVCGGRCPIPTPMTAFDCSPSVSQSTKGSTVTWSASTAGGTGPFSYDWSDVYGVVDE